MAARILPTPEQLRKLLRYEPDTGKLFWLPRPQEMFTAGNTSAAANCAAWNKRQAGAEAFISDSHGYRSGGIFGVKMLAHRVIWAIFYGEWPDFEVDHVNLIRSDNRIANLRRASSSENKHNTRMQANNTSGYKGVTWHRQRGKWAAQIFFEGRHKSLGLYESADAAHAAYCAAAEKYHGDFARTS